MLTRPTDFGAGLDMAHTLARNGAMAVPTLRDAPGGDFPLLGLSETHQRLPDVS
jgi:hypothetical protein